MHRLAVLAVVAAACRFEADYAGGVYACSDGVCPAGLVCNASEVCVDPDLPIDAPLAIDGAEPDAGPDAPAAALTCADPGLAVDDQTYVETTAGGTNRIAAQCTAGIYNAPDDVWVVTLAANQDLRVEITGASDLAAYVITSCVASPGMCTGSMAATDGFPLVLADLPADDYFVVVDGTAAAGGRDYTLTVRISP